MFGAALLNLISSSLRKLRRQCCSCRVVVCTHTKKKTRSYRSAKMYTEENWKLNLCRVRTAVNGHIELNAYMLMHVGGWPKISQQYEQQSALHVHYHMLGSPSSPSKPSPPCLQQRDCGRGQANTHLRPCSVTFYATPQQSIKTLAS